MDGKMLARLGAIIFVAIAITATVIEMTRQTVRIVRIEQRQAAQPAKATGESPS